MNCSILGIRIVGWKLKDMWVGEEKREVMGKLCKKNYSFMELGIGKEEKKGGGENKGWDWVLEGKVMRFIECFE